MNATYGHEAGDLVLAEVGRRLATVSRDADAFFRLGGDEFSALLETCQQPQGAIIMAQRISEAIDVPIETPEHTYTASPMK